jgi:large subunit ribosomal protein L3
MGNRGVTVKNLRVVAVDPEKNELWVRGGVPGTRGSVVKIRKAGE